MNDIKVIQERILRVIRIERDITTRERDEFRQKKHDEEIYWGMGGNYRRFEQAEEKREQHLAELDALERGFGGIRPTEELRLYPFYCPTCQLTTYLSVKASRGRNEVIDCPICNRTIYRAADSVSWEVIQGSRRAKT